MEILLGKSQKAHEVLEVETTSRTDFRKGNLAMLPLYKGPAVNTFVNIKLGNSSECQLHNLKVDIGQ